MIKDAKPDMDEDIRVEKEIENAISQVYFTNPLAFCIISEPTAAAIAIWVETMKVCLWSN